MEKHLPIIQNNKLRHPILRTESTTAGTTGLVKVAVRCSADTFMANQTFVLRITTCLPAGRFVVKIATFAKSETVTFNGRTLLT